MKEKNMNFSLLYLIVVKLALKIVWWAAGAEWYKYLNSN